MVTNSVLYLITSKPSRSLLPNPKEDQKKLIMKKTQLLSPLSPAPFLSAPLSFTLVYLWARLNSNVRLSLFGVITISAGHLPYALVLYFFTEIWKRELGSGEKNWLKTPDVLVRLIDGPEAL
ncbi:hypothetical protein H4Q26_008022 [Puccinia striiformis f. sp. tritici PST-130]|nr:hypothetical protein H4Q26_008022 [Puccinia striiformis f. sp. tritici PST-130]